MRPYRPAGPGEHPRGGYLVPARPAPLQRPSRLAAGMAATLARKRDLSKPSDAALALSVRGTLDALAASRFDLVRQPCPCCGQRDPARLGLAPGRARTRRLALARRFPPRPLP